MYVCMYVCVYVCMCVYFFPFKLVMFHGYVNVYWRVSVFSPEVGREAGDEHVTTAAAAPAAFDENHLLGFGGGAKQLLAIPQVPRESWWGHG